MLNQRKLLVICGPTATGKTQLGIKLAKEFGGEIVSADSRQVYKGMDIGTGKEILNIKYQIANLQIKNKKFLVYKIKNVPVWLWDVVEPDEKFSVAEYVNLARQIIEDIWGRGKLPIIVGGTGFYIKGLIDGIETLGIEPNWELRDQLKNKKTEELKDILKKIWPKRFSAMNESDRSNPRRLIRAIEVGQNIEPYFARASLDTQRTESMDVLMIGLTALKEILYQRIDKRVDERIKMGAEKEVKQLLGKGFNWENSVLGKTPGYMEWQPFLDGNAVLEEVAKQWKFDEYAYARRQMTWFKKALRQAQGVWFDITEQDIEQKIAKIVTFWYNKSQNAKKN